VGVECFADSWMGGEPPQQLYVATLPIVAPKMKKPQRRKGAGGGAGAQGTGEILKRGNILQKLDRFCTTENVASKHKHRSCEHN